MARRLGVSEMTIRKLLRRLGAAPDADIVRIRLSQLSLHRPWQWGAGWLAGQLRERVACFRPVSPGGSTNQKSGDSLRGANDMGVSPYIIPSFPA